MTRDEHQTITMAAAAELIRQARADEGKRNAIAEVERAWAERADLRAKVEALRGKWQRSVDRDPDGKLSGYDRAHVAALGDVLDLIDGADS